MTLQGWNSLFLSYLLKMEQYLHWYKCLPFYIFYERKENLHDIIRKISLLFKCSNHCCLKEIALTIVLHPEIQYLNTSTQVFHTYRINLSPFTKDFRVRGTINWESTNLSSSSFNEELPYCQTNTMCFNNWGKLVFNSSTYQFVAGIQLVRRVTWQRGRRWVK